MGKVERFKIAFIGAGHVGATAAQYCAEMELGDIVLTDVVEGLAEAKALDLSQAGALRGHGVSITGSSDYASIAGSDVCVVTAGLPRKPGMSRLDLLAKNGAIMADIAREIARHAPDSVIIAVTNPLDVMAYTLFEITGFPNERVVGMAGCLDSARLRCFAALELGVNVKNMDTMVLGSHGDHMVPLPEYTTVSGVPINKLMNEAQIERLIERTRKGGGEIVSLLKTGSAYYAPGASAARMVQSILRDERQVLPCSAHLSGQYGLEDIYLGVPAVLGRKGVEDIVELALTKSQLQALKTSAEEVRSGISQLRQNSILQETG